MTTLTQIKNNFVPTTDGVHPLTATWKHIDALSELGENWNGYMVSAPNPDAMEAAKQWVSFLYDEIIGTKYPWKKPHVSADEEGNVVFEWVQAKKRLAVYVSPGESLYIKAWGPSIASDMSDGDAGVPAERLDFWAWFAEGA